jgi:hypothetical protein
MGQNDRFQAVAEEDGCVYIYDLTAKKWQKVCDDIGAKSVPKSVWDKLKMTQETSIKR